MTRRLISACAAAAACTAAVALSPATPVHAQTVSGFSGFTLNGNASVASNVLTLTNTTSTNTSSAFYSSLVKYSGGFTASWTYTAHNISNGDGAAFVLQTAGSSAIGSAGGSNFGYAGIAGTSIAITYQVRNGNATSLATDGTLSGQTFSVPPNTVNYSNGDAITMTVSYSSASNQLVETIADPSKSTSFTASYTTDLSSVIGNGGYAYVGLTGADGAALVGQQISNFTYAASAPEPSAALFAIPGLMALSGEILRRRKRMLA